MRENKIDTIMHYAAQSHVGTLTCVCISLYFVRVLLS